MRSRPLWRVAPPLPLAETVRRMAIAEGRTDANMLLRLVSEALSTRRAADHQITKLADAIRTVASNKAA